MNGAAAQMKTNLTALGARIDDLSLRERGLVFLALMALLYTAASVVLFAPLHQQRAVVEQQIMESRRQIRTYEEQLQAIAARGTRGTVEQRARLASLEQELRSLDAELGDVARRLVPPKEMAKLVEQMLARNRKLQVVEIESIPPTPLFGGAGVQAVTGGPAPGVLYKHGMRVRFKGGYGDIVNYLRALEELPWRMFWGELSLSATQYPVSTVTLVIYTVSTQEAWIGV